MLSLMGFFAVCVKTDLLQGFIRCISSSKVCDLFCALTVFGCVAVATFFFCFLFFLLFVVCLRFRAFKCETIVQRCTNMMCFAQFVRFSGLSFF